jgi:hypothetical protein
MPSPLFRNLVDAAVIHSSSAMIGEGCPNAIAPWLGRLFSIRPCPLQSIVHAIETAVSSQTEGALPFFCFILGIFS